MLEVRNLTVAYNGLTAIRDCSLRVAEGEVVGIAGPNGAGKSSLLKAIFGQVTVMRGEVVWDDEVISQKTTERISSRGLSLVPEGHNTFRSLTVLENLGIGRGKKSSGSEDDLEEIYTLFPILKVRSAVAAGNLSGGEQQQLAIALALLSKPKLLVIDEPSLGLAPKVIEEVYRVLHRLKAKGRTIVVVEERMARILDLADRIYVLRNGRIQVEHDVSRVDLRSRLDDAYFGISPE